MARLRPPHWRLYPSAARLASLPDPPAETAARLGARLIADDLARLGHHRRLPAGARSSGGRGGSGDRRPGLWQRSGAASRASAGAVCAGLLEGGVLPVIKHIPGHGRARVDSHHACPLVETSCDELSRTDFAPFRALADHALGDDRAHRLHGDRSGGAGDAVAARDRGGHPRRDRLRRRSRLRRSVDAGARRRARRADAAGARRRLRSRLALQRRPRRDGGGRRGGAADFAAARRRGSARGEALRRSSAPNGFDRAEAEAQFDALLAGARRSELAER